MNTFSLIMKIAAALAVIAGIVFVVVAYGDKIVALGKKLLGRKSAGECDSDDFDFEAELADTAVAADVDFEG